MPLLQWKHEYSVGIDAVDYEHKELIALINRLHDELVGTSVKSSVSDFFGDLLEGISAHFALEEKFMHERGYDQFSQHKGDHERLLDEVREIMDEYEDSDRFDDAEIASRLETWFSRHFETHDARLHGILGAHPHRAPSGTQ